MPTSNTGYGDAQPAVDAYLKWSELYYTASRNPSPENQAAAEKPLQGQALTVIGNALTTWRQTGVEWIGTPPAPQLAIDDQSQLHAPLPTVRFSSCLVSSATGWSATAHGTAVPSPTPSPGPVFARTVTLVKSGDSWSIVLFDSSKTRTCPS